MVWALDLDRRTPLCFDIYEVRDEEFSIPVPNGLRAYSITWFSNLMQSRASSRVITSHKEFQYLGRKSRAAVWTGSGRSLGYFHYLTLDVVDPWGKAEKTWIIMLKELYKHYAIYIAAAKRKAMEISTESSSSDKYRKTD
jgi:hypothetical protein